jgi:hypothetical protein
MFAEGVRTDYRVPRRRTYPPGKPRFSNTSKKAFESVVMLDLQSTKSRYRSLVLINTDSLPSLPESGVGGENVKIAVFSILRLGQSRSNSAKASWISFSHAARVPRRLGTQLWISKGATMGFDFVVAL